MKRLQTAINKVDELLAREIEKRVELHAMPPECEGVKPSKIKQGFIKAIRRDEAPYCDVRIRTAVPILNSGATNFLSSYIVYLTL